MEGKIVGVTGANGYLAMHLVQQLLEKGYSVRGTVRSKERASRDYEFIANNLKNEKFSLFEAEFKENAFDEFADGCDYIIHAATPFTHEFVKDPQKEIVEPAINGTITVLKSAAKAKSVKRVVITSSIQAIHCDHDDHGKGHINTEEDWNSRGTLDYVPYSLSKKMAEKAAWEFMEKSKPHFDLSVINPGAIYGPALDKAVRGESVILIKDIMEGKLPLVNLQLGVIDVRDVARAHIIAMTESKAAGQRFLCVNQALSIIEMAAILKKKFPDWPVSSKKLPAFALNFWRPANHGQKLAKQNVGKPYLFSNEKIKTTLNFEFTPAENMLEDMGNSLISFGVVQQKNGNSCTIL